MADKNIGIKLAVDATEVRNIQSATDSLGRMERSLGSLSGVAGLFGAAIGGIGFTALVRQMGEAGMAIERLRNSFAAATGGIATGAAEFEFARREANRLGLDLQTTADAYMKLAAASRGTSLEGDKTRRIFSSVAESGRALGLSADQMQGALLAISQMMSKGTVQAEELKGQLGERIPQAVQIAARAMGVTTAELGKMLEKGEVIASDFLPRFADELQKTFPAGEKATSGLTAEVSRLKTSFFELKTAIMDNGGNTIFAALARDAASAFSEIAKGIDQIGNKKDFWDKLNSFLALTRRRGLGQFLPEDQRPSPETETDYGTLTLMRPDTYLNAPKGPTDTPPPKTGKTGKTGLTEAQRIALGDAKDQVKSFFKFVDDEVQAQLASEQWTWNRFSLLSGDGLRGTGKGLAGMLSGKPGKFSLGTYTIEPGGGESREERLRQSRLAATALDLAKARQLAEIETREAQGTITATAAQREKLAVLQEIVDLENRRLEELPRASAEEQIAWNQQAAKLEGVKKQVADLQRVLRLRDGWEGMKQALTDYVESVNNLGEQLGGMVNTTFKGMEDALVRFVQTGKLSFSALVDSIVADLARIAIRQTITGPLASGLLSMFGGGDSGLVQNSLGSANALGSAWQGGVQQFAGGGLVVRPTYFGMANGGLGLMGEAGPEAIMPLARGADGKLGVRAAGGNLTVNAPITLGDNNKRLASELRSEIEATVVRVVRKHS